MKQKQWIYFDNAIIDMSKVVSVQITSDSLYSLQFILKRKKTIFVNFAGDVARTNALEKVKVFLKHNNS